MLSFLLSLKFYIESIVQEGCVLYNSFISSYIIEKDMKYNQRNMKYISIVKSVVKRYSYELPTINKK